MSRAFREFLYRPWTLSENLSALVEDFTVLDSACKSMTANYNKIGGSGGGGGKSSDGPLALIADLVSKIRLYQRQLADAESQLDKFTEELLPRDRAIIRYRYVLRLQWEDIQNAMLAKGYRCNAMRTLFYWHEEALKHAEQTWEEKYCDFTDE